MIMKYYEINLLTILTLKKLHEQSFLIEMASVQ